MTERSSKKPAGNRSRTTAGKKSSQTNTGRKKTGSTSSGRAKEEFDFALKYEIILVSLLALVVFLFLCTIGVIGSEEGNLGNKVKEIMLGTFGYLSYIVPLLIFIGIAFGISNLGSRLAKMKITAGTIMLILVGIITHMIFNSDMNQAGSTGMISSLYQSQNGGGVVFGLIGYGLYLVVGNSGCIFITLVAGIICMIILTQKSFIKTVKESSKKVYDTTKSDVEHLKKMKSEAESTSQNSVSSDKHTASEANKPEKADDKSGELRIHKKVSGVTASTNISSSISDCNEVISPIHEQDIHEITIDLPPSNNHVKRDININNFYDDAPEPVSVISNSITSEPAIEETIPLTPLSSIRKGNSIVQRTESDSEISVPIIETDFNKICTQKTETDESVEKERPKAVLPSLNERKDTVETVTLPEMKPNRTYRFPPVTLLGKPISTGSGSNNQQLKETGLKLEQILETFGVKVTVTDISQGPAVTRYELQPEQGVKVSRILSLSDDIKLNLAASDIRIEAPIPGKAAVGIEVPNTTSSSVCLRELIELKEFKDFPSKLAFAVGRDIAGMPVITDIAKMPHMLIAGATGSGKSVCINTIIMSILYKSHPDDVKMIMIDPKVVELSVYNGIPHLMIPVVTDPKRAAGALQWGVAEMTERYKKFAEQGVRDLKGYNQKAENQNVSDSNENKLIKMPQILIIVDELADLMMVASKDVEEAICRLAQLARAAGIHLIIATQRPSVDVITGLIKANMPSRIAFSVSSGVDSRTILDMNGAEKLLGKGDMLFYPQGYTKPSRVQGAFVTDEEVSKITDFLKNQKLNPQYNEEIEARLSDMNSNPNGTSSGTDDLDIYFKEAGRLVIEKEKASIGMLQRAFKIGFNRAARIVDQLEASSVVSAEDGTKPRRILMSMEEFEDYISQI